MLYYGSKEIATKKLMYNNDTKSAQDRKYNTWTQCHKILIIKQQ
jgi:hypothetical protein